MPLVRLLVAVALLTITAPAVADDQPWATGVSDDRKRDAQKLLEDGNKQFIAKDFKVALATYEAAIKVWDHPAIRFNVVRTLIALDRPLEAIDHLELALKYGAAPLEETVYTEAVNYQKLLAGRVVQLEIKCDQKDVDVTLDGKPLGKCPLAVTRRLEPGPHQVVGRLPGHVTRTRDIVMVGGKHETVELSLERGATGTVIVHRWPTWIPWVVFGAGFAVAGIGGMLDLKAAADMNNFENAVAAACGEMACTRGDDRIPNKVYDLEKSAERTSAIAIGIMSVGFATVATGAAMLYLNRGKRIERPRIVRIDALRGGGAAVGVGGSF